ncbi:MAG TPA: efflux transporter outer membrane subunit [Povalibacter sp.]|nr:efflux transporter outer membrane subunit [Povalibacter sp.]
MNSVQNRILKLAVATTLVAANVMLSACAVGPQFQRPQAPAVDNYTATQSSAPVVGESVQAQQFDLGASLPSDWWVLFKSPELNGLIEQAQASNQTLAAAQATVEQARALTEARTGARYPQVDLTAGTGRQKYGKQFLGPISPPPPFTYFAFGPNVSYTLDYTGGVGRAIEQQQALTEYQQWQLQAARLAVTGNVVQRALEVAASRDQMRALDDVLADDRRTLDMIRAAHEAGSVSRVDVLSAQNQLASDETLLPPLRQQLSIAQHELAVLIGQTPATASLADLSLSSFTLPQQLPVNLPSELAHRRPDILAAEAQLHAATAAVGVATANLYPRITLSASLSQQALEASELFDSSNTAWSLISGVTAPLFDGGKLRAERRAAVAALAAESAKYQQVVLESFAQVANALDAINHSAEQLAAQSQALTIAQQSLDLTRESYNEGNVGVLQVLESERLYQQARLGYVRAQAQRLQDTARLFVALGAPQNETVASR